MVSIFSFMPSYATDKVEPEATPHVMVGAASPLWLMFGGAAAAGATFWWWTNRWREAVNLESLMALAPEPVAPRVETAPALEPIQDLAAKPVSEAVVETAEAVADASLDLAEAVAAPVAMQEPPATESVAAEPVPAVAPAPVAEAVETAVDDLTRLVGVGPKLAASLADLGVTKFSQIAAWSPDEVASYDQLLNLKGRAEREAWVAQAKRFAGPAGA